MWTELYFSQSASKVKKLVEMLDKAEIISKVRGFDSEGGECSKTCYKVLVPSAELEDAQNLMVESDLF